MVDSSLAESPPDSHSRPPCTEPSIAFRVHGSPRHEGRTIRIRGQKCTIGSDPACTLRLRGSGIAPWQCLVVRGPEATIARNWSRQTLLNGQSFSTAPLREGDRLTIGPVELEIIDTQGMPVEDGVGASQKTRSTSAQTRAIQHGRLRSILEELRDRRGQLAAAQDRAHEEAFESQRRLAERQQLENQLQAARVQLTESSQERDELQSELQRVLPEAQHANSRIEEHEARIQQLVDDLEARHAEATGNESRIRQLEEELKTQRDENQSIRAELESGPEDSPLDSEEHYHLQRRCQELEGMSVVQQSELNSLRSLLEEAERRFADLQNEMAQLQAQIDAGENAPSPPDQEDRDALASSASALAAERAALAARMADWEQQSSEMQVHFDHLAAENRSAQRQLEDEKEALEEERSAWQREKELLEARIHEMERALQEKREAFGTEADNQEEATSGPSAPENEIQPETSSEALNWERLKQEILNEAEHQGSGEERQASNLASQSHQPTEYFLDLTDSQQDADSADDRPDVDSRIEELEQFPSEEEANRTGEVTTFEGAEEPASSQPDMTTVMDRPSEPAEAEDDIDAYMQRLLLRSRGIDESAEPKKPSAATSTPANHSQEKPLNQGDASSPSATPHEEVTLAQPVERVRRLPPELSSDLSAMRELANMSAQTAIDTHAHKLWTVAAVGKAAVSLLGAATGVTMFTFFEGSLAIIGGAIACSVALFWGYQATVLVGQVLRVNRQQRITQTERESETHS